MTYRITINMDNAAFADSPGTEIGRILQEQVHILEGVTDMRPGDKTVLIDVNGNVVGEAKVSR